MWWFYHPSTRSSPQGDASRLTRNGAFIMEALLLSSLLSCSDAQWFVSGINSTDLTQKERSELIVEIIQHMPDDCTIDRDAKRP